MTRILVFGDSMVYGSWDDKGGWVQKLKNNLDHRFMKDNNLKFFVYNLGVQRDTSSDLLKRLDPEIKSRFIEDHKIILIFSIGTNDAKFAKNKNTLNISPDNFRKNLGLILKKALNYSSKIIFVGTPPVIESQTTPQRLDPNGYWFDKNVELYDNMTKDLCKKNKIPFVDVRSAFQKRENLEKLFYDGLHPNSKGHELIFKLVLAELKKNKYLLKNQ
jgi:acyl-CoA thioesterase-1